MLSHKNSNPHGKVCVAQDGGVGVGFAVCMCAPVLTIGHVVNNIVNALSCVLMNHVCVCRFHIALMYLTQNHPPPSPLITPLIHPHPPTPPNLAGGLSSLGLPGWNAPNTTDTTTDPAVDDVAQRAPSPPAQHSMLDYDPDLEEYLKVAEAPMSGAGSSAGELDGGEEEDGDESDLDLEGYFNQLQADGSDAEEDGGGDGEAKGEEVGGGEEEKGGEDDNDDDDVQDLDDALADLLKGDDE